MEAIIGKEFPAKVIPLIENSQKNIDVIVFDWRWYPNDPSNPVSLFNQAICRAVRRGVKVRALVNSAQIAGSLREIGCEVKKYNSTGLLHVKLMIVDNSSVILGSHNYSQNAFTMNHELSVIVSEAGKLSKFLVYFQDMWDNM